MKSLRWICVAAVLVSVPALACDQSKAKAGSTKAKSKKGETGYVTGSYTKQTVNRYGRITDGASPVHVIDQESIRRSGASDVRQLLVRKGVFQ